MALTATEKDNIGALAAAMYYRFADFGYTRRPSMKQIAEDLELTNRHQVHEAIDSAIREGLVEFGISTGGDRNRALEFRLVSTIRDADNKPILSKDVTRVANPLFPTSKPISRDKVASLVRMILKEAGTLPDSEHSHNPEGEVARWEVAQCGAELLHELMLSKSTTGHVTIGISVGETLRATAHAMQPISPPNDIRLVTTAGAFGGRMTSIDSASIVLHMLDKLGTDKAKSYMLPAPAFVPDKEMQDWFFRGIRATKDVVAMWKTSDVLITGIGGIDRDSTMLSQWGKFGGAITEEDLKLLRGHLDAVGDMALHFFTKTTGAPIPTPKQYSKGNPADKQIARILESIGYPISCTLDDLKKAAADSGRHSIAIGAGKGKVLPYLGALIGKRVDGLVTDVITAQRLLDAWGKP